jgi:NADPH:quinone reductase-like Zn-dependent oxidoreductase
VQAVVIHETGGPEVLRYEDAAPPAASEGEVLVRVQAVSLNPIDWKQRGGSRPPAMPAVLGRDISGVVERSLSAEFAEGDEVFGWTISGGYAQFATASAGQIAPKPAGLTHVQAAALPVAGVTAWQALFDVGGLERDQTALIAGAAGGVGHLAVQFAAKVAGARTIGTASDRNRGFVLGLGADEFVDYTEQNVADAVQGVNLALDTVGGDVTAQLVPTLAEGGTLVTIANAPPEDAAREHGARAELLVSSSNSAQLAHIGELVASGQIHVEIAEVLPLREIRRAHELSEAGHVRGKIVLTV